MCLATQSETRISEVCMHHAFLCKMQVKRVDFCISQENKDDRLAESVSQSFFNPLKKKEKKVFLNFRNIPIYMDQHGLQ